MLDVQRYSTYSELVVHAVLLHAVVGVCRVNYLVYFEYLQST